MYSQIKLCVCHQVRRRRPDTRLNLQYDKLYVNNVAYWFNEDTEEIELVNQSDGDIESQVWMVAWSGEIHILCVLGKYFCLAIINIFAHFQTVMKAAAGTRLKKRDGTPSKRRKNFMSKSYSSGKGVMRAEIVMDLFISPSDSVANLSGSPVKEAVFTMDPMLEHALDFDTDDDEEHGD